MNITVLDEAIAKIASTSEALENYCNDPKNYNNSGAGMLEQMSWELYRQANELREFQYRYGRC
jgi:hypothetical protein